MDEPAERRRAALSSIAKRFSAVTSATPDDEFASGETAEEQQRLDAEAGLNDLNRMRLTRHHCEKWVHYPFFDVLAVGCVVRVGFGNDPKRKGQSLYKVCIFLALL